MDVTTTRAVLRQVARQRRDLANQQRLMALGDAVDEQERQ